MSFMNRPLISFLPHHTPASIVCLSHRKKNKCKWKSLSCVRLSVIPWTVACQAPLSMELSRQESWSEVVVPSPGDLPDPGIRTQVSRTAGEFFTIWATREAQEYWSGSPSGLQGIFPNQRLNRGLLHCRRILYQRSHTPFNSLKFLCSLMLPGLCTHQVHTGACAPLGPHFSCHLFCFSWKTSIVRWRLEVY